MSSPRAFSVSRIPSAPKKQMPTLSRVFLSESVLFDVTLAPKKDCRSKSMICEYLGKERGIIFEDASIDDEGVSRQINFKHVLGNDEFDVDDVDLCDFDDDDLPEEYYPTAANTFDKNEFAAL